MRILSSMILIACCLMIPASTALAEKYNAQVIGVPDGDTIEVLHAGKSETVMLN